MTTNKHILLVDGMALLFRGFYATAFRRQFMENKDGIPTNGIYQFMRYFRHAVNHFEPSHIFCCWDLGKETFRTEIYQPYKANRESPPEELVPQFDLIKKVMDIYQVPNISKPNFEADDCIGSLANKYKNQAQITILSGDQDFQQLVDQNVQLAYMLRGQGNYRLFTRDNFYEKLELKPEQIIDMKALMGDSADNYPGVKGIGEKTAFKLITTYGSIENLLDHLDELSPAMRRRIEDNIDMLHLSKELAEIRCDLELNESLEAAAIDFDHDQIYDALKQLNLEHIHE